MIFNSIAFAIFLPIVFCIYWTLPHKYRWILLLVSSYYFYMSWNPKYIALILLTTMVSYAAGILLEMELSHKKKKIVVIFALIICFAVLLVFKYLNFVLENIYLLLAAFSLRVNPITVSLLLPVGISFYTFQTVSYIIDVYKGKVKAEHNFGIYATFISFFPQLVAGPIERTQNLLPQIKKRRVFDYDMAMYGARQMLWGFFKKIAVADVVSVYVDNAYSHLQTCSGFDLAVAAFFFTVQIYCDFSGYSDIAIGTAKLFGINLMRNFSSPYFSLSVKEFWSRWHISLSTWFRDYVYIPLGGNRCSKIKSYYNLFVTFLISGLWHGANWTFIMWGGVHGVAQICEKKFGLDKKKKGKISGFMAWFFVFVFCNLSWIFFRADSFRDAVFVISGIFRNITDPASFLYCTIGLSKKRLLFILCMIFIVACYDYLELKKDVILCLGHLRRAKRLIIEYIVVVCIGVALLFGTGSNQFVYFQF